MLINGGTDIWQRGESFSFANSYGGYTADSWSFICLLSAPATVISRSYDVPPGVPVTSSMKATFEGAPGETALIRQRVQPLLIGVPLTLSFWTKGPAGATGYVTVSDVAATSVIYTGDWQHIVLPGAKLPSVAEEIFADALRHLSKAGDYFLTALKLEVGREATPFAPEDPAIALMRCQRRFAPIGAVDMIFGADSIQTDDIYFTVAVPVTMRATPSISNPGALVVYAYGAEQSGFTFTVMLTSANRIMLRAHKDGHGLTQAVLVVSDVCFFNAEI
jgi:hypothetical protein